MFIERPLYLRGNESLRGLVHPIAIDAIYRSSILRPNSISSMGQIYRFAWQSLGLDPDKFNSIPEKMAGIPLDTITQTLSHQTLDEAHTTLELYFSRIPIGDDNQRSLTDFMSKVISDHVERVLWREIKKDDIKKVVSNKLDIKQNLNHYPSMNELVEMLKKDPKNPAFSYLIWLNGLGEIAILSIWELAFLLQRSEYSDTNITFFKMEDLRDFRAWAMQTVINSSTSNTQIIDL